MLSFCLIFPAHLFTANMPLLPRNILLQFANGALLYLPDPIMGYRITLTNIRHAFPRGTQHENFLFTGCALALLQQVFKQERIQRFRHLTVRSCPCSRNTDTCKQSFKGRFCRLGIGCG